MKRRCLKTAFFLPCDRFNTPCSGSHTRDRTANKGRVQYRNCDSEPPTESWAEPRVPEAEWGVVEASLAGEVAAEASFAVVVAAEANVAGAVVVATAVVLAERGVAWLVQGAAGRARRAGPPAVVPEAGEPERQVWATLRFFLLPGKR